MFWFQFKPPGQDKWRGDGRATLEKAEALRAEHAADGCEVTEIWERKGSVHTGNNGRRPLRVCNPWGKDCDASVNYVYRLCYKVLEREGLLDEYFSRLHPFDGYRGHEGREVERWRDLRFNQHRWVACYPVEGGNEGDYVHVDLIGNGVVTQVFLAKTFQGPKHACKIANRLAELLGA
jgi:hypothetical protein